MSQQEKIGAESIRHTERGSALTEMALVVSFIAVVAVTSVTSVGSSVDGRLHLAAGGFDSSPKFGIADPERFSGSTSNHQASIGVD